MEDSKLLLIVSSTVLVIQNLVFLRIGPVAYLELLPPGAEHFADPFLSITAYNLSKIGENESYE